MLEIKIEKSFKKDIEKAKKSGLYHDKDFELLKEIITKLQTNTQIEDKFKRHTLKGSMKDYESIHIKSDWVLIFKLDKQYLYLIMIGKHTQVYKKFK